MTETSEESVDEETEEDKLLKNFVDLGTYEESEAIVWALKHEIIAGVSDTQYMPEASITQEDLADIMSRYAKYCGESMKLSVPADEKALLATPQEVCKTVVDFLESCMGYDLADYYKKASVKAADKEDKALAICTELGLIEWDGEKEEVCRAEMADLLYQMEQASETLQKAEGNGKTASADKKGTTGNPGTTVTPGTAAAPSTGSGTGGSSNSGSGSSGSNNNSSSNSGANSGGSTGTGSGTGSGAGTEEPSVPDPVLAEYNVFHIDYSNADEFDGWMCVAEDANIRWDFAFADDSEVDGGYTFFVPRKRGVMEIESHAFQVQPDKYEKLIFTAECVQFSGKNDTAIELEVYYSTDYGKTWVTTPVQLTKTETEVLAKDTKGSGDVISYVSEDLSALAGDKAITMLKLNPYGNTSVAAQGINNSNVPGFRLISVDLNGWAYEDPGSTVYTERDDAPYIQKLVDEAVADSVTGVKTVTISENPNDPENPTVWKIGSTVYLPSNTTVILDGCTLVYNDRVFCNMFASEGLYEPQCADLAELTNIKILGQNGATLNGGEYNQWSERNAGFPKIFDNSFIHFRNVDGFEVSGLKCMDSRYWNMMYHFCENGKIHDIEFNARNTARNQDGIDLRIGCHDIDIYNITGQAGDDVVALTALDHAADVPWRVAGKTDEDIHDVTIKNINAGCSGGHGVIRLLAMDGNRVYNISMDKVRDSSLDGIGARCNGMIRIGDTAYGTAATVADIYDDITIGEVTSNANYAIYIGDSRIKKENITVTDVSKIACERGAVDNKGWWKVEIPAVFPLEYKGGNSSTLMLKGWQTSTDRTGDAEGYIGETKTSWTNWILGSVTGKKLYVVTPELAIDRTTHTNVTLEMKVWRHTGQAPDPELDVKVYYSVDKGTTWSSTEVTMTAEQTGEIFKYPNTANPTHSGPVTVYTSTNLNALMTAANANITNLKIVPYASSESTTGAFRVLEMKVYNKEGSAERDDAPYIQKLVDEAVADPVTGIKTVTLSTNPKDTNNPTVWQMGSTVYLPSNTTVVLDGCTLIYNDDVFCNMFASKGLYEPQGATMDELKNIKILGQNGATLHGGNYNQWSETTAGFPKIFDNSFIHFRNVDGFEVSGLKCVDSRYWNMMYHFCENGKIHDIEFDARNTAPNQDGIDLRIGCHDIEIYNITGQAGDDVIALTALDHAADVPWRVAGKTDEDIHDISIKNVNAGCSGGHGVIRLLAMDGNRVYKVAMDDIRDASLDGKGRRCNGMIRIGDTSYGTASTAQNIYDEITIGSVISNANYALYVNDTRITKQNITVTDVADIECKYGSISNKDWWSVPVSAVFPLSYTGGNSGTLVAKGWSTSTNRVNDLKGYLGDAEASWTNWILGNVTGDGLYIATPELAIDRTVHTNATLEMKVWRNTLPAEDPEFNMKVYYSVDKGTTWASTEVTMEKTETGETFNYPNNTSPTHSGAVVVYASTNLNQLMTTANANITNLKIVPFAGCESTTGAFRVLEIKVYNKEGSGSESGGESGGQTPTDPTTPPSGDEGGSESQQDIVYLANTKDEFARWGTVSGMSGGELFSRGGTGTLDGVDTFYYYWNGGQNPQIIEVTTPELTIDRSKFESLKLEMKAWNYAGDDPAFNMQIQYSTDGGSTWADLGISQEQTNSTYTLVYGGTNYSGPVTVWTANNLLEVMGSENANITHFKVKPFVNAQGSAGAFRVLSFVISGEEKAKEPVAIYQVSGSDTTTLQSWTAAADAGAKNTYQGTLDGASAPYFIWALNTNCKAKDLYVQTPSLADKEINAAKYSALKVELKTWRNKPGTGDPDLSSMQISYSTDDGQSWTAMTPVTVTEIGTYVYTADATNNGPAYTFTAQLSLEGLGNSTISHIKIQPFASDNEAIGGGLRLIDFKITGVEK